MGFGPDFYENEAASRPAETQRQEAPARVRAQEKSAQNKGAVIAMIIGAVIAIAGMLYPAFIAPEAEGVIQLSAFGAALVGGIIFLVGARKSRSKR